MKQSIDTYFKEKLFAREFEMNQDHWQQALELLEDNESKKRRGLLFWWSGGIFSSLAIIAMFLFLNNENKSNNTINTAQIEIENKLVKTEEVSIKGPKKPIENKSKLATKVNRVNNNSEKTVNKPLQKNKNLINELLITDLNKPQDLVKGGEKINENEKPNIELNKKENKSTNLFSLKKIAPLLILVKGNFTKNNEQELDPENACFRPNPFHIGLTASQLMQPFPKSGENLITAHAAGIVAQYDLNKNWFISSGAQYMRRDGHFMASKMTETRNYRFGLELMENEMRPSSLHYISLPLMVGRQKGHHLLEGGILFDFLIGVRGEIGKLEKTDPDVNKKEFVAQEKGWIAENGFTKFNVSPSLGYRYRVNKELSFGISVQYALNRLADEPEMGDYILRENDRLQLRAQAVYFLNK